MVGYAYVGMPCHIEGLRKIQFVAEGKFAENVELTIGLFCRENWVFSCFRALIEEDYGVSMQEVKKFDIKKGNIIVHKKDGSKVEIPLLNSKPFVRINCKVCFDFAAELADLAIGAIGTPAKWSTVIVRTEKGREFLSGAEKEGYIEVKPIEEVKPGVKLIKKIAREKIDEAKEEVEKRAEYGFDIKHYKTYGMSIDEIKALAKGKNFDDLIDEVIDAGACTSCGACSAICPENILEIEYERPEVKGTCPEDCNLCYLVCPRVSLPKEEIEKRIFPEDVEYEEELGKFLEIFAVRAKDEKILEKAQDGGAVTAILSYALDKGLIKGVVSMKSEEWRPKATVSKSKEELLATAGTIYSSGTSLPLLRRIADEGD